MRCAFGSKFAGSLKEASVARRGALMFPGYVMMPPVRILWGTVFWSKRTTMPKLLVPPLRARKRAAWEEGLAWMRVPLARTTSKFVTESQA